ncbi:MAG: peptidylprolyl isomerase [Acidobacteriota bacterium]
MKIAKTALVAACVLGTAISGFVDGQTRKSQVEAKETFTQITAQEMNLLLADAAEANPVAVRRFEDDPELRRKQIESLRDLLALASDAQKVGLADRKEFRNELENIAAEMTAISYDRHINKRRSPFENQGPSFGKITDAMVASYWGESPGSPLSAAVKMARNAKFEQFLDTKLYILGTGDPDLKGKPLSENERNASRWMYARTQIYADEYARRSALLPLSFKQKVKIQIKLQQAQFLARLYAEQLAADTVVFDAEIATYMNAHPELDTVGDRAMAEKILARAKSGEDFAKLANEFTEDPGNKDATGQLQGGLYQGVNLGVMLPRFEKAAIALEAGQISPELVETDFGYHILKLESKSSDKYDVRHILIATAVSDPSNPGARPVPVKEYVKKNLENEKERGIIDRIIVANKISVPEDFVVPRVVIPGEAPKTTPKATPPARRKRS